MKLRWGVGLLSAACAYGQVEPKPQMAEEGFKNIQVLKGISVSELMETMGFFAASLGLNCTDCHVSESSGDWARYADDTALKRTTRVMISMVNDLNKRAFGGRRAVTCYSCHRGTGQPKVIPNLAEQYSTPPPDDPNEIEILGQASSTPSVDSILDKFIQAIGGPERLANLRSFVAKGTYQGYDTDSEKVPVEIFSKGPDQRAMIVHLRIGDSTTTYDGHAGWIAAPDRPLPLLTLGGEDLDGIRLDAESAFPARIKEILGRWRAGFPRAAIADREVQIVQGTAAGGSRVKLFFEKQSGLLVRMVRYTDTAVGIIPTQTDYSDYREVDGVMMPFRWTLTWTDGQSTTELTELQPNVAIDPVKFAKPAPASPPKSFAR